MERNTIGHKVKCMGVEQHICRHGWVAAKLARQRPFSPGTVSEDAAEHTGTRRGACDLFNFLNTIHGEHGDAVVVGTRNIALLLDGVAKRNPVGGSTGIQSHLDFGNARRIKTRTEISQKLQNFRRWVGLYGIKNTRVRHGARKSFIIVSNNFEINDEARAFWSSVTEEIKNAGGCGHVHISQKRLRHQSALKTHAMETWS